MLYVRVELWPFGNQANATVLGEATIVNDGTGDTYAGNYEVALLKDATVQATGRVEGFSRLSLHAWHLVRRSLEVVLGGGEAPRRKVGG